MNFNMKKLLKNGFFNVMKIKMKNLITILLSLCLISGCMKNYVEPVIIPQVISFSNDIIPIFSNACLGCHTNGGMYPGLILSSDVAYNQLWTDGVNAPYLDTIDPVSSTLYIKMNTSMPPSGTLSNEKISLVLEWINNGAKNN